MPIFNSNTPLVVATAFTPNGVPFTGLLFLKGEQFNIGACCGDAGDCVMVSFENGIFQSAAIAGAATCPEDFSVIGQVELLPSTTGGIYSVGYRWGDPQDLLASMPGDGCCYTAELEIPDVPDMEWADLPGISLPLNSARDELLDCQAALGALTLEYDNLVVVNDALQAAFDALQALSDGLADQVLELENEVMQLEDENALLQDINDQLQGDNSAMEQLEETEDEACAKGIQDEIAALGELSPVHIPCVSMDCEQGKCMGSGGDAAEDDLLKGAKLEPVFVELKTECDSPSGADCCDELLPTPFER